MKHIGRHNDRKIVVLYREVPGEAHMCLVVYPDVIPRLIHDSLMSAIESDAGQASKEISEVLHRTIMADGRKLLEVLHREGMIKKVPTSQILITPNAKSSVRLDELNKILNEMAKGEEAIQRLAELDKHAGMTTRKPASDREVGVPQVSRTAAEVEGTMSAEAYVSTGVLSDADLATQRVAQALAMRKNAESLLAEAARLESEAQALTQPATPAPTNGTRKTTKAKASKKQEA